MTRPKPKASALTDFLAPIKALCACATEGPWLMFARGKTISVSLPGKFGETPCVVNWPGFDGCGLSLRKQRANAAFIVAARLGVPALIAVVEAQERAHAHLLQKDRVWLSPEELAAWERDEAALAALLEKRT